MNVRSLDTGAYFGTAALVATVATVGSLYFSLGMGLTPCDLCWYQRICMYPLVAILGIGAYRGPTDLHPIVLSLSVPGTLLSAYHSYLQYASGGVGSCSLGGGCTAVQYELLGLSIPNMALISFVLITVLTVLSFKTAR